MKNITVNLSLIFILISLVGCQSAYYSAMEKVGKHKRDILIDRVESATESQEEAKEEFKNALEQFSALVNFDGGELQQQYEISNNHYHTSKVATDDVTARINAIEDVAEALFNEWHDELDQFTNQSLKRQSQSRYRETQSSYASVIESMRNAERRMQPILNALKDNMLYLKHNLNARAIGELKTEYKLIEQDVERLINEMNSSINKSQIFIKSLKTT
jgi:Mor family transcriptional regulator